MTTIIMQKQCRDCAHLLGWVTPERWRCAAFPLGVPPIIQEGEHDHRIPLAEDNGIQYKKADSEAK